MTSINEITRAFPIHDWHASKATDLARDVRDLLSNGWLGDHATEVANDIDWLFGPDDYRSRCVSIPFRTRQGKVVTLFGGWIHACPYVSWDVIGKNEDGKIGEWDDERFPEGLSCLRTHELIRAIRTL